MDAPDRLTVKQSWLQCASPDLAGRVHNAARRFSNSLEANADLGNDLGQRPTPHLELIAMLVDFGENGLYSSLRPS
jgi:hypothetical protein